MHSRYFLSGLREAVDLPGGTHFPSAVPARRALERDLRAAPGECKHPFTVAPSSHGHPVHKPAMGDRRE